MSTTQQDNVARVKRIRKAALAYSGDCEMSGATDMLADLMHWLGDDFENVLRLARDHHAVERTATLIDDAEPTNSVWSRAAASSAWVRVTDEEADDCLNVLPPIYFTGGFAVSEPIRDDAKGRPVYLAIVTAGGKIWAKELARGDMDEEAAALRNALK